MSEANARRQFVIAATTLVGVIVVMTIVFVANSKLFEPAPNDRATAHATAAASPALDRPDGGQTPTRPGDRGGSAQLALLGLLVVAIGGGTATVVRSSRKARRANAAADQTPVPASRSTEVIVRRTAADVRATE